MSIWQLWFFIYILGRYHQMRGKRSTVPIQVCGYNWFLNFQSVVCFGDSILDPLLFQDPFRASQFIFRWIKKNQPFLKTAICCYLLATRCLLIDYHFFLFTHKHLGKQYSRQWQSSCHFSTSSAFTFTSSVPGLFCMLSKQYGSVSTSISYPPNLPVQYR